MLPARLLREGHSVQFKLAMLLQVTTIMDGMGGMELIGLIMPTIFP
jgi:hypothetical protein